MFHFSRRTLWIIIYVTIPLIIILNSLGPDDSDQPDAQSVSSWSLDEVQMSCAEQLCSLPLPGAETLQISVLSGMMPTTRLEVPSALQISATAQGGQFIVTVTTAASRANIKTAISFLREWLPEAGKQIVVSGNLDGNTTELLESLSDGYIGTGAEYQPGQASGLGVLQSPPLGSSEQLPFLMWVEVLKQRLAGYDVTLQWDHRGSASYVSFSSTLHTEDFRPVENDELDPILQAYLQTAQQRQRSAAQLHRYAVTAVAYELPFSFFVDQQQRLQAISLDAVNQVREDALEQIQKEKR
ncbi:hypothetical protein [Reinekea marinisedimentorum]|uniref:Uncharacterized protein n=1 Tax=Reinekea marinisedimentorum TaxID=230495 RepID=A0A4R3HY28_9GAMM|nr:hypothetical protein [Reinekea marinisedimentorum]TCS37191.1 hypothetical protein BCF53_12050 [Reinekea marinisedimentorum]